VYFHKSANTPRTLQQPAEQNNNQNTYSHPIHPIKQISVIKFEFADKSDLENDYYTHCTTPALTLDIRK
jgi:hypothetical protein